MRHLSQFEIHSFNLFGECGVICVALNYNSFFQSNKFVELHSFIPQIFVCGLQVRNLSLQALVHLDLILVPCH
jgi:hypothetical protein